jgi:hypothetical protein
MSMDILGTLFNSSARVKIMRLFLLNPKTVLTASAVSMRSSVTSAMARKELSLLARAGLIIRKKERVKGKRAIEGWALDTSFQYHDALANLLFGTEFIDHEELGKRFKRTGRIKLLLLSGVFNGTDDARLDLLLVGDNLKRPAIERIIRSLEAEIGKELAYAIFETADFIYRASMYDKLIRDVIDFPHESLISQSGLLEQIPHVTTA